MADKNRNSSIAQGYAQFRAEILDLLICYNGDLDTLLKDIAGKLLDISGADQVIFRAGELRIIVNSEEMEQLGQIPKEYCAQCPHSDIFNAVYKDGYTVMNDCREGAHGVPVYEKCPVRSALTRLVYHDGKPVGYLALHYISDCHVFGPEEQESFERLTGVLESIYSRFVGRRQTEHILAEREAEKSRALAVISTMAEDFDYIISTNVKTGEIVFYTASDKFRWTEDRIDPSLTGGRRLDAFFKTIIHPEDWDRFLTLSSEKNLSRQLKNGQVYKFNCRVLSPGGADEFYRFKFALMPDDPDIRILGLLNIDSQIRREMEMAELERRQELTETAEQLKHTQFRADALAYFADNEGDPIEFLRAFADRLRVMLGCDQIIYRDLSEVKVMINSPEIEKTWAVPIEYCEQCAHLDPFHRMYRNGVTEMSDCAKGFEGIPTYPDCPIKSSLTRIVYVNGEVGGYIAIHYVVNYHEFTQLERDTLQDFTKVFSLSLSRYEARTKNAELENELILREEIKRSNTLVNILSDDYISMYTLNAGTGEIRTVSKEKMISEAKTLSDTLDPRKAMEIYISRFVHPDDREKLLAATDPDNLRLNLEHASRYRMTFRSLRDGDIYRYVDFVAGKDGDAESPVTEIVMGFQDVDERVRTEKNYQAKLEQALAISDYFISSYVSAYYVDLNTAECTVLRRTEALDRDYPIMNDYISSIDDYISKDVHPDDRAMVFALLRPDYIRSRLESEGEYSFVFRDMSYGTEKNYRLQVIRGADASHAAFGFMDITDELQKEKQAQTVLEEALTMAQSANRAKTTFLNNMSHDIRTPMNAIIGYTGLAASHLDNREQLQDYLKKIGQSSDHLLSLINDVLDMSRIESGKMNIDENPESLPEIMHTLRNIIQTDVKAKELDFFMDTADVTDEIIICDKLRLNQVLLNVLSNAIKYTQPGGTVSLRIIQKSVSDNGYGEYEFRVKDNGMGMSEEFLETIFDPFTRVKSSTVSGIQGTGLGMAITKNIVDMMGGTIDILSAEGEGTEVIIDFRFRLGDAQQNVEKIVELEGLRGLVVDDDMNACKSISKMLRDCGMRSEWCESGRVAVVKAEEAHSIGDSFRVFIIDWLMPDMNGIETTRRIRRVVGDEAPIVILTAYDWSDIEDEAREAGVTAFISKPLFPSDLHSVLEKCMGREAEPEAEEDVEYDFTGRKILLVEDNPMNREIAEEILTEDGFIVETAEDGDIAVEMVNASYERNDMKFSDYDLVLMDTQMPRMDGYTAARAIRSAPPVEKRVPIIAMTANAFEEARKAALESGMDEHIAKPIDVKKLKETLAKYM